MAAQPECMRCGMYVYYGDVMCDDCVRALRKTINELIDDCNRLQAEVDRLTKLLLEMETILPNGELGVQKEPTP